MIPKLKYLPCQQGPRPASAKRLERTLLLSCCVYVVIYRCKRGVLTENHGHFPCVTVLEDIRRPYQRPTPYQKQEPPLLLV